METADCLESRVFWAIILWSLCGPQRSKYFVVKDHKGFIQKDAEGIPIPGKLKNLLSLLGLAPGMKGHVSRAVQRLKEKKSIRFEGNLLYIEEAPPPAESPNEVAKLGNWNIAGVVVKLGNLPSDPVARASSIQWLNELRLGYNGSVKTLKSGYRELLSQGVSEGRILIVLDEKRRRGEKLASSPPDPSAPEPPHREPIRGVVAERFPEAEFQNSENDKTHTALRGAPLERLRLRMIERAKQGPFNAGLISTLANEVGLAWQREQSLNARAAPIRDNRELIADIRLHWNDYTDAQKQEYCEIFEELRE